MIFPCSGKELSNLVDPASSSHINRTDHGKLLIQVSNSSMTIGLQNTVGKTLKEDGTSAISNKVRGHASPLREVEDELCTSHGPPKTLNFAPISTPIPFLNSAKHPKYNFGTLRGMPRL